MQIEMTQNQELPQELNSKKIPSYPYHSIARLILFSIISFGLYQIYWFYQHWGAIKEYDNSKIMPPLRSVFGVIFCYPLFARIAKDLKRAGYKELKFPLLYALTFIVAITFSKIGLLQMSIENVLGGLLCITVGCFSCLLLFPFQIRINKMNSDAHEIRNQPLTWVGKTLLVCTLILFLIIVFTTVSPLFLPRSYFV